MFGRDFLEHLADYYTATELVEFLDLPTDTIIYALMDEIRERYPELCEDMNYEHI